MYQAHCLIEAEHFTPQITAQLLNSLMPRGPAAKPRMLTPPAPLPPRCVRWRGPVRTRRIVLADTQSPSPLTQRSTDRS